MDFRYGPDELDYPLIEPVLAGALRGITEPLEGAHGIWTVQVTAVVPGLWISVGLRRPPVSLAELTSVASINLTGDADGASLLEWSRCDVMLDDSPIEAVQADFENRRAIEFTMSDLAVDVSIQYVTEPPRTSMALTSTVDLSHYKSFDQAFFAQASRRFSG